ncbi:MAG TPA: hypothetical protein VGU66_16715 [Candidatus Elarobacter sp.]|nr:hypothetical protein [Candidatus Elarobacter sp.]
MKSDDQVSSTVPQQKDRSQCRLREALAVNWSCPAFVETFWFDIKPQRSSVARMRWVIDSRARVRAGNKQGGYSAGAAITTVMSPTRSMTRKTIRFTAIP